MRVCLNAGAMSMYNPAVIANYFLEKGASESRALTPMQVQKLVYLAHGWHLGYGFGPLVNETPEAWKYGPVFRSLYYAMSQYGGGPVTYLLKTGPDPLDLDAHVESGRTKDLLDAVWKNYAQFSGFQLSSITHLEGTPWHEAWHILGGKNSMGFEIGRELIEKYYSGRIEAIRSNG
ncbi:hypothetical protein CO615_04140 [Lysobacteraceae bacterium NML75-0749]|nr:hypothetical protein CO615_04140 [Xanthomonadaceae bacterium NML75-0749]